MYDQVHEGMDVFDRNGEKIGKAGETLGQFFNVDAGFLGMKEYYVPFDAITEVRDDAVYVNADKDEIDRLGWDRHPDERSSTAGATTGATTGATSEGDTMRLREEQLETRTTPVETGRVQVGKDIVEEQRRVDVPVTREEVVVERHPVDRRPADQPIDATERETIEVPVREEQVEVEKRPVVYEEVGIGKRTTRDTEQVSDTVRREELRVDREGDASLGGTVDTTEEK
jgi:uncharacterized protein (TIGR02271 family)